MNTCLLDLELPKITVDVIANRSNENVVFTECFDIIHKGAFVVNALMENSLMVPVVTS